MKPKIKSIISTLLALGAVVVGGAYWSGQQGNPVSDALSSVGLEVIASESESLLNSITSAISEAASPGGSTHEAGTRSPSAPITDFSELSGTLFTSHYIDVGQANAVFLEFPNGECMLIDGGNRDDGDLVVDYISGLGYDVIDYVVATHPHEDHIGGLPDVFNAFVVERIYMPRVTAGTKIFGTLMQAIEGEGIEPTYVLGRQDIIATSDLAVFTLGPNETYYSDLNDYSVVMKVEYGETGFLYTGDATATAEAELVESVVADVLMVGHHGSNTSSDPAFVSRVSPSIAVFSLGADNEYGHPHSRVWSLITSVVPTEFAFRTDEDGTIVIASNGAEIAHATSK